MTPVEAVLLTRWVEACCPQQRFDEYTTDAWYEILQDLELQDCKDAVSEVARRQPFVAPAEIHAEVKRVRGLRLKGFVYVPVPGDDDPDVYLENLRAQRAAVGSGRREADPTALSANPSTVRELNR
jgi:hypothetical protein